MNIWKELEIEPTKDKNIIKNAYRHKLQGVNPEDDPDGFMNLRTAYDEAIRLADADDAETESELEKDPVYAAIKEIYSDFYTRIQLEAWQKLFDLDYFVALDKSEDSFHILLRFLMENFCLPQKVWKLIIETFDIPLRRKELAELYPEDFIDYIINNATYDDTVNYYLFEGDTEDVDRYIDLYYKLDAAIRMRDVDKQQELIDELSSIDAYHPYLELLIVKHELQVLYNNTREQQEDEDVSLYSLYPDKLNDLYKQTISLAEEFGDDSTVLMAAGDLAMNVEDYDAAEEYYDRALKLCEDDYLIKAKQADLAYYKGDYEKSRDMYMDLLKKNHYDNNVRAGMIRANFALIDGYKKILEDNPGDDKTRLEMAWSYYQSYKFHEAIEVLDEFSPDEEKLCEYNNVKGRTYLCLFDYENALKCFYTWKEAIEKIPADDDSDEALEKKKRYEYVNFLIADCYIKTDRLEEAGHHLDIALKKEHDEIILSYEARCELYYLMREYDMCIKACEELIERENRNYLAYSFMAKAYYELDLANETMNACEHAIAIYPYVAEPYVQEIKVYLKYNQIDGAKSVVERYKCFEIDSDNIKFFEAVISIREGDTDRAEDIFKNIIDNANPIESDLENFEDAYMELAAIYQDKEKYDEAIELYEKVIELKPEHEHAYGQKGMVLKYLGRYEEAVDFLTKQLQVKPYAFYYINRGILYRFMSRIDDAASDFNSALELEPDNSYCYSRLGLIYEYKKEFEAALDSYDRAIVCLEDSDDDALAQVMAHRARLLQCMNRFDEAGAQYDEYLQKFGLVADVMYDYSELLLRMNRLDDAVLILTRCINELEYSDDVQMCIRQLCFVYGQEGYVDKAHESFLLAISKRSDDMRAYVTMAEVFKEYEIYDKAKELFEKAVVLDKDNKQNYYSELVEVILKKKTIFKQDVKKYVEKALDSAGSATTPMDFVKLVRIYRVTKKYKQALSLSEKALKQARCSGCFYGECYELWYEKALLYEQMKDYEMARICYRRAIEICGHNALFEEKLKRIEDK